MTEAHHYPDIEARRGVELEGRRQAMREIRLHYVTRRQLQCEAVV